MRAVLKPRKLIYIAAAAILIAAIAVAIAALNTGPKLPNVKFVDFSPEGMNTLKQGQQIAIKFNIENNENYEVSSASVRTSYDGAQQYFLVDKPVLPISNVIGAEKGRSGQQTVTVTGMANDQQAVESNFSVSLYVGSDLTDTKTLKLRLEK